MTADITLPVLRWFALLALCAAYLQGGVNKLLDFEGAVAEAMHFGLPLPRVVATSTIFLELGASVLVLSGRARWLGALALGLFTLAATFVANRFWELPPGLPRFMTANAFHEHLGLVGAWLLVLLLDRQEGRR